MLKSEKYDIMPLNEYTELKEVNEIMWGFIDSQLSVLEQEKEVNLEVISLRPGLIGLNFNQQHCAVCLLLNMEENRIVKRITFLNKPGMDCLKSLEAVVRPRFFSAMGISYVKPKPSSWVPQRDPSSYIW